MTISPLSIIPGTQISRSGSRGIMEGLEGGSKGRPGYFRDISIVFS
jgi:hypothetical protein